MKAAILAALVLATVLAPLAAADHVFSHRLYVSGRLLDKDGLPWPGAAVVVAFEGLPPDLPRCAVLAGQAEVTGPQGDFLICRHTHALPKGLTATVSAGGVNATKTVDVALRHVAFELRSDLPRGAQDVQGDRDFNATFRVAVRAYELLRNQTKVEGVPVDAVPLAGENVSVALRDAGGVVFAKGDGSTDDVGDVTIDLATRRFPGDSTLRVAVAGAERIVDASPEFRRADVYAVREPIATFDDDRPGTATPTPAPAWLAFAAVGLGALLLRKRS